MKTIYRDTIPNCNICNATDLSIAYDMPFSGGHWVNCCEGCRLKMDTPNHPAGVRMVKGENPKRAAAEKKEKDFAFDQYENEQSRNLVPDVSVEKVRQRVEQEHADGLSMEEIEAMVMDSVVEAADGCSVEPDGTCPHGYKSPLLVLGVL